MSNLEDQLKDQWIKVVEQYLDTVKWCVDTSNHGGGILGYSAALLLLCTTDAIGHGLRPPIKGKYTRLDVLMESPFDPILKCELDPSKVDNLEGWYRNMLAHTGTMSPDVGLEPHTQGRPFDFNQKKNLTLIRVPVFYEVVKTAWEKRERSVFYPQSMGDRKPPDPSAQPADYVSSLSPTFSGVVSPFQA
jgi:hypothetical protein